MTARCPGTRQRPTRFVATLKGECPACHRTVDLAVSGTVLPHEVPS